MTGVRITEEEHAALIERSSDKRREDGGPRTVYCSFGPSGVKLLGTDSNRWALLALAEMRGIDLSAAGR